MNIEELLNNVKQVKAAQDSSSIAQNLTPDQKNTMPKNIVAKGEDGDAAKIEELLAEIARTGEEPTAAEALLAARMAEEVAEQDMDVIGKQASFFGTVMADAMIDRLSSVNEVTEKEASDAAEEQYMQWHAAGAAMADGYLDKLAAVQEEATAGVINEKAMPAQINQEEADEIDENELDYIAAEMARDLELLETGPDAPKSASEKEANFYGVLRHHLGRLAANAKGVPGKATGAFKGVKDKMQGGYRYAKNNKGTVGLYGGGAAALTGGGYIAGLHNDKKVSTDEILEAYKAGNIDAKAAAQAIASR